jgi:polyphenol oxidase
MPIIFVDMSLPQPIGEFEWVQEPWGAALSCVPLAEVARHCFSTSGLKLEGILPDGRTGWQYLAETLGVSPESIARMRQVHCAGVFEARRGEENSNPEADIAVTDDPAVAVAVKTADCVPVLLADRRTGAVAAIHAGWRGTAAGAAIVAVRALASRYGAKAGDIIAAVGPSIGPCCYEVGPDLAIHFSAHPEASTWFTRDEKPHLNLWRATRDQLQRAGVPPGQIHVCGLCTFENSSVFHSYRRDGSTAGRLVAAIRNAPGRMP